MDKVIEKKTGFAAAFTKNAIKYWVAGAAVVLIGVLVFTGRGSKLRVDGSALIVEKAKQGEFNDYIRVSGQVQPMTTVQISPTEGGNVQRIVAEEGNKVNAGDVIVILSNESLDMQILNSEAELAEKENILRNTMISMEQQKLSVRQEKLTLQVEVRRAKRAYEQKKSLYEDKLIAREEFLKAEEDYELAKDKLDLVVEREYQDSLYRGTQIAQMHESLDNMRINMNMIRRRKENLSVKAPISGELGLLDVELGQTLSAGARIGQINNLDSYKIEAQIDEHYIDRISAGLEATFERQNEKYSAVIRKVYPEVRDGKFKADFRFDGQQPENIRTGQTYYLNLQLGQSAEAVLIPRGSFYQNTGGRWIYVVSDDGTKAVKRSIRIGRQNPQYYEVLEGIAPGESVIVSSYDSFGDKDELIIRQ
ncbi:MAG TPA: efflux transporter periplasmic adaptor subunit [Rikenellaceae bacterium]|nr:efflux transporter periplasmic adaptor subunit [Rikenellaceae bacterium]